MRLGLLLFLSTLLIACAQTRIHPVKSAAHHNNTETELVAFSVVSEGPFPLRGLTFEKMGGGIKIFKSPKLHIKPGGPSGQLFLYEVPAAGAQFGIVTLKSNRYVWQTRSEGAVIVPVPGSITYLGRIQVEALRFRRSEDSTRTRLNAVRIIVTDASEADFPMLADRYNISGLKLQAAIPKKWSDSEFTELKQIRSPYERSVYSGSGGGADTSRGSYPPPTPSSN